MRISRPYKLVSREFRPADRVVEVPSAAGPIRIGAGRLTFLAGPCAVESEAQLMATAKAVKAAGAHLLRGGAFKPRTNPYEFQGLGEDGLKLLAEARERTGLPVVTEVTGCDKIDLVMRYADVLQIGTRNMRSYDLLKSVGSATAATQMPILLKRGDNATIVEFLNAAEYIAKEGNENIILCLRGIRTYESDGKYLRNTPDIGALPVVRSECHLPVVFDPSHSTGKRYLVRPVALAAIAAGADGLLIESHYRPDLAKCDGQQSVTPDELKTLFEMCRKIREITQADLSRASRPNGRP